MLHLGLASTDQLSAYGNLLLGVGTVTAAVGAWVGAGRSRAAKEHAQHAQTAARSAENVTVGNRRIAEQVHASVGDANGQTINELLHKIVDFEQYQHNRNHDVLSQLSLVTGGIPLLIELTQAQTSILTQILDRLPPLPSNGDVP